MIIMKSVHYSLLLYFYGAIGLFFYIINRTIHGYLQIWNLFRVLNRISHSFALITREISWSTLEINFTFPGIHVLFCLNHALSSFLSNLNHIHIFFDYLKYFFLFRFHVLPKALLKFGCLASQHHTISRRIIVNPIDANANLIEQISSASQNVSIDESALDMAFG